MKNEKLQMVSGGKYARPLLMICLSLVLAAGTLEAGGRRGPGTRLTSLSYSNPELMRLRREISLNLRSIAGSGRLAVPLRFMVYKVRKRDNFFRVMARVSQNADTLATLNEIAHPNALLPGERLLIPNARGLFVPASADRAKLARSYGVSAFSMRRVGRYWFIPGHRFTVKHRDFFTGRGFRRPLDRGRLTSGFGMRRDPFTRKATFHGGIDIAAPRGARVRAAQDGVVVFAGRRGGYGKLIILRHRFGYETYYGHLSRIHVRKGRRVKSGALIGRVGSTGRSTGPHLHFEVRKRGVRKRPRFVHGLSYHPRRR